MLRRWKWAIAYSVFLLGSVSLAREILGWLQERELSGLLSVGLLLAAAAGTGFLLHRLRTVQGRITLRTLLRLTLFLGVYLYLAVSLTVATVERVHFIQYGVLGILCVHAVDARHGRARRIIYAITAGFLVGFVDEIIQGLVELRYYDDHDVILNLCSVGLPVLGLFWLPLSKAGRPGALPRRGYQGRAEAGTDAAGPPADPDWFPRPGEKPEGRFRLRRGLRFADLAVLAVAVAVPLGMQWINRAQWDLSLLAGIWERENLCGMRERLEIRKEGVMRWQDAQGNEGEALYDIGGNRLDGPCLHVRVLSGQGEGLCAWRQGMRRTHYFEVNEDRLVFKKRLPRIFTRVHP